MKKQSINVMKYLITFIFVLYFTLWALSPYLSKHFIKQPLISLGLTISEQSYLSYNPFISQLTVKDLQLHKNEHKVFAIKHLEIELSLLRLLFKQLYINTFSLQGLYTSVKLNDDQVILAGVKLPQSNKQQPSSAESDADLVAGYKLILPRLDILSSKIDLTYQQQAIPISLNEFTLKGLTANNKQQEVETFADLKVINAKVKINAHAKLNQKQGEIQSTVSLIDAELSTIEPWLPEQFKNIIGTLNMTSNPLVKISENKIETTINEASLSVNNFSVDNQKLLFEIDNQQLQLANFSMLVSADKLEKLTGKGRISVNRLSAKNKENTQLLVGSIEQIINEEFVISTLNSNPQLFFQTLTLNNVMVSKDTSSELPAFTQFAQLAVNNAKISKTNSEISQITITDLNIDSQLDQDKQLLSLLAIQKSNDTTVEESAKPHDKKPPELEQNYSFNLGAFELVNDAHIHFKDNSVMPTYQRTFTISKFVVGPFNTDIPEQESTINIQGKSNEYAKFNINGIAKPFLSVPYYSVNGDLKEVSLPAISAYIKNTLKYEIKSGQLNVILDAELSGDNISGNTNILVRGLDLTAADDSEVDSLKDKTAIPFSVALNMLKDSNGNVELDVPLSGSTKDPSFAISGFLTLIVKQATMAAAKDYLMTTFVPYSQVVSIALSAGEHLLKVRFNDLIYTAGQFEIENKHKDFLQQFGRLMQDKPETQVTICPVASIADLALKESNKPIQNADYQKLTELSEKRFHRFKQYMIDTYQLNSARLLMCTPQVDSSPNALPRITFKT